MNEIGDNINKINLKQLARNTPVALVVGAASFFGSHLVDKLLAKNLQVIGVDDLTDGKKDNLSQASENKNFHLIIESADYLHLDLGRLDYVFMVPQRGLTYQKTLDLFRRLKPRLLLISSIELYDEKKAEESLNYLKKIESEIAKIAKSDNLNARILRLGAVFGPRMNFDPAPYGAGLDPVVRLIQQALTGDLQKDTALEFSSRALFVDDACNLAVRCIFAGATAQKIFDGVLIHPVKVSEIKQILLDPVWYENKDFSPSELPPWPTPNLEKTIKFLNWHPGPKLISNLRKTLTFFRDNEIKVPKIEKGKMEEGEEDSSPSSQAKLGEWKKEKARDLQGLKGDRQKDGEEKQAKEGAKKKIRIPKMFSGSLLAVWVGILIIIYALVWPVIQLGWGVLTFRFQLLSAINNLGKGEFDKSLSSIAQANAGVAEAKSIFYSLAPIRKTGLLKSQFELGDNLANLATQSVDSAQNTILGIQNLYQSLKSITGEQDESPKDYIDLAKAYLASADENLSKAQALIGSSDFKSNLPKMLHSRVDSLSERLSVYAGLVKKARALSTVLPEVVAIDGSKNYLVLLQDNMELRPTGGFIRSFARVTFEDGKLKKLETNDISAIDGQLNLHVEPPQEIKDSLNQKDYFLRDSNWEPDFPTSARVAEWFYAKETGERVAGVVALDISAIKDLLSVSGPLNLPDYNEKISADNLFEKAVSYAKKSFLTVLETALFNKLFFLPNQNWPGIVTSLGRSLEGKHLSIYLDNPPLFSYVISQNWGGVLPRGTPNQEESAFDFLAPVEANLGANKANYYLDRSYNLETVISKDGEISHRLRIAYTNRSPSATFPAGKYKNRMRVYLPTGTKLTRALWGESEITKASFVDYGRVGYSFLVELAPKEQKTLVLDYQTSLKLKFKGNIAAYRLDIVKQAGTLKDPLVWTVTYPINMRLRANQDQKIGPQEYSIQTELSADKTFKLEFSHP